MKKYIITLFIIIGFISIFYYENRNFISVNNLNNSAIISYNSGSFEESIHILSGAIIKSKNNILYYNLGNSFFKHGETINITEEKADYYMQALDSYSGSLALKYERQVQENYDFVKNKLDELLNPDAENQQEQENQNSNNTEENQSDENNKESRRQEDNLNNTQEGEEQEGNPSNTDNTQEPDKQESVESKLEGDKEGGKLSENEKKQIEKYAEDLKKSEFYNQEYFNKQPPQADENIDDFFTDSFFEDSFSRGGKKDW